MDERAENPSIQTAVRKKSWISVPSLSGGFVKRALPTSQPIDDSEGSVVNFQVQRCTEVYRGVVFQ